MGNKQTGNNCDIVTELPPLQLDCLQDHDQDFSVFYNRVADMLEEQL
jgi:hypothetical protein